MWDDDPELLHATLALLLPCTHSIKEASSSRSSGGVVEATEKRRCVNKSRECQREELRMLRTLAVKLEAELVAIKKKQQKQLLPARQVAQRKLDIARLWKATALRQFHARKRAELVNRKPRLALQQYDLVAHELQQAFRGIDNTLQLLPQWSLGPHAPHSHFPTEDELLKRIADECGHFQAPFSVF